MMEPDRRGSRDGSARSAGPAGPAGFSAIPGEVRLWPGGTLPNPANYGKWVWADGAVYPIATYPLAAGKLERSGELSLGRVILEGLISVYPICEVW